MKSGAGDDPFADDETEDKTELTEGTERMEESTPRQPGREPAAADERTQESAEQLSDLPYKYRRSSVKEGRTQQPMFLQAETADLIDETLADIESQFDEDVYKTDIVEAMIVAGGENTTPEAVLRRWGYGMKNER